jgi:hypothetical protein
MSGSERAREAARQATVVAASPATRGLMLPMTSAGFAGVAQDLHRLLDALAGDDDDHADAAVEDAMHFAVGNAAFALQPVEQLRTRPGACDDLGPDRAPAGCAAHCR